MWETALLLETTVRTSAHEAYSLREARIKQAVKLTDPDKADQNPAPAVGYYGRRIYGLLS